LITGWILGFLAYLGILGLYRNDEFAILGLAGLAYLVYWIWQAYDANKKAKYYNDFVINNRKEPW
jgi:threonine/homoserine/homoserine lactone efflux protein